MLLCQDCGGRHAFRAKDNLFLCAKCMETNKQVYHNRYCKVTKYGLPLWILISKWQWQSLSCAICKDAGFPFFELHVDHDHETGRVRGLLCNSCNIALKEKLDLQGVLKYLIDFKEGRRGFIRPHPERGIAEVSKKEKIKIRKYLPNHCEACYSKKSGRMWDAFFIDHCHTTGVIRGHLCMTCNHTLGLFKDSVVLLKLAIAYLDNAGMYEGVFVEPELVWPVTHVENAEEVKILRSRKKAELTPEGVKEIRALFAGGMNKNQIAKKVRRDPGTIHQIVNRITWKHVE